MYMCGDPTKKLNPWKEERYLCVYLSTCKYLFRKVTQLLPFSTQRQIYFYSYYKISTIYIFLLFLSQYDFLSSIIRFQRTKT